MKLYNVSGDTIEANRTIVLAMIGTAVVTMLAEARKGDLGKSAPRVVIGGAIAFFFIGAIAVSQPTLAKMLALLLLVGTVFTRGVDAFDVARNQTKPKKKGKK